MHEFGAASTSTFKFLYIHRPEPSVDINADHFLYLTYATLQCVDVPNILANLPCYNTVVGKDNENNREMAIITIRSMYILVSCFPDVTYPGEYHFNNGDVYVGGWSNHRMEGKGKMVYANGAGEYEGRCVAALLDSTKNWKSTWCQYHSTRRMFHSLSSCTA